MIRPWLNIVLKVQNYDRLKIIMAINYYAPKKELEIAENIFKTNIDGLYYIKYKKFIDDRGFFSQILHFQAFL